MGIIFPLVEIGLTDLLNMGWVQLRPLPSGSDRPAAGNVKGGGTGGTQVLSTTDQQSNITSTKS